MVYGDKYGDSRRSCCLSSYYFYSDLFDDTFYNYRSSTIQCDDFSRNAPTIPITIPIMPISMSQPEVKKLIMNSQPKKPTQPPHLINGRKFTLSITPQLSQLSLFELNLKYLTPQDGQKLDFTILFEVFKTDRKQNAPIKRALQALLLQP